MNLGSLSVELIGYASTAMPVLKERPAMPGGTWGSRGEEGWGGGGKGGRGVSRVQADLGLGSPVSPILLPNAIGATFGPFFLFSCML